MAALVLWGITLAVALEAAMSKVTVPAGVLAAAKRANALTPGQKAKLGAELDAFLPARGYGTRAYREAQTRQAARPKVVAEEGRIVREAEVQVSPADPNWREGPRPGFVVIDQVALEREWRAARRAEEWNRQDAARRQRESFGLNLYPRGRY
jgi:hypothetical protein